MLLSTAAAYATMLVCSAGDFEFTVETVALTGDEAPGTPEGVFFSAFTTPLNHSIMRPRIDADGNVMFVAFVAGPGIDATNNQGIWAEDGTTLRLVARTGDPAPDTEPDTVFEGLPNSFLPFTPPFSGNSAATSAELTGPAVDGLNDQGIFAETSGGFSLVVRESDDAPGTARGVAFVSVSQPLPGPDGSIVFQGNVNGPGVTIANDEGVWRAHDGAIELLAREGQPAPGTGAFFGRGLFTTGSSTFFEIASGGASSLVIQANLLGPGVTAFSDETVYVDQGAGLELLLREGDQAPGLDDGIVFGGGSGIAFFRFFTINTQGQTGFTARLSGGIPTTSTLWSNFTGELGIVFRPGDPAPGQDYDFSISSTLLVNNAGHIAFAAAAPDDDGDIFTPPPFGIWYDQNGELENLVHPGDPTPHQPGGEFISTTMHGYGADGHVLFTAGWNDPESGAKTGLFLAEPGGTLAHVVSVGDPIDVSGDGSDFRVVQRIMPGGISDNGIALVRLDFIGDTSAHMRLHSSEAGVPGDATGDGVVNVLDLLAVLQDFGVCGDPCPADLNGDGDVNVLDMLLVLTNWT